jgi:hypothetical protein
MYVAYVLSGCCKSRSNVAYVLMAIHVCCKCMFQMFQFFQMYVASVSSRCCICSSGYICMLQVCFSNVLAVLSECCICCSNYTRILQVYVSNVSPILDACCKCFIYMLHMLQRALTRGHAWATRTHTSLPISVMRVAPIVKRARNRRLVSKRSSTPWSKVHAHMQSMPAPNGCRTRCPYTTRLGLLRWSM